MPATRVAAVAGRYYPANAHSLEHMVNDFLDMADSGHGVPKAIIVPHARYTYSGSVAASAYARLRAASDTIKRVILLGPSHRVPFLGLAMSSADSFATPLGKVPVDPSAAQQLDTLSYVRILDVAHVWEHSLEVQLPFLQRTLREFKLVPLLVGNATPGQVSEVLQRLWGDFETVIIVASDLSRYHDFDTAKRCDAATSRAIEALDIEHIGPKEAFGCIAVKGLLLAAQQLGFSATGIDVRNSAETMGPRAHVAGYGAYVFQR